MMEVTRPAITIRRPPQPPPPPLPISQRITTEDELLEELRNLPMPTRALPTVTPPSSSSALPPTVVRQDSINNELMQQVIQSNACDIAERLGNADSVQPDLDDVKSVESDQIPVSEVAPVEILPVDPTVQSTVSQPSSVNSGNVSALSRHMEQQLHEFMQPAVQQSSSSMVSVPPPPFTTAVRQQSTNSEPAAHITPSSAVAATVPAEPLTAPILNVIPPAEVKDDELDHPPSYHSIMSLSTTADHRTQPIASTASRLSQLASPQHTLHSLFRPREYKYNIADLPKQIEYPHVRLSHTPQQRAAHDSNADMYALIVTMEHLELAYIRDGVSADTYAQQCQKLLMQYKTLSSALIGQDIVNTQFDIYQFCSQHQLACKQAAHRFKAGQPATSRQNGTGNLSNMQLTIFYATQHFIHALDLLKLKNTAVDQLYPAISAVNDSLNKLSDIAYDSDIKGKTGEWMDKLQTMKASDELQEGDIRQLTFDMDRAYNSFHQYVQTGAIRS